MTEATFLPSSDLRPWIASIHRFSTVADAPRTFVRLPSGESSVVFCLDGSETKLHVVGPTMRASYKLAAHVPLYVRFTFSPGGAAALLGVAGHELTQRIVPFDLLATAGDLDAPTRDDDAAAAVARIERVLRRRIASARARSRLADEAQRRLAVGDRSVAAVADELGVGERRLRQVCLDELGLTPKHIARVARIRRAVARAGTAGWAAVAAETGFYDQAHLTAEFRALLGVSPRRFLAGNVPTHSACANA